MSPSFFPIFFCSVYKFINNLLIFFWPVYLNSIGLSGLQIGLLSGLMTITSLATILPAGFSNDRFRSKYLILFGLLFYGLYLALSSYTTNFIALIPLFIIGGLGGNLFGISVESLFYRITNNHQALQKVKNFTSISLFFAGLGVLLGSQLFSFLSFPEILRFLLLIIIALILFSFFIPNTNTYRFEFAHYKKDFFQKKVFLFLSIFFLLAFHYGAENTSYSLFVKNNLHLNNQQTGLFIGLCIMSMFFWIRLAVTKIEKKTPLKNILYLGLILSGLGHILLAYPNFYTSFIFRVIHEAGDAFLLVILYHGITKIFPVERIGGLSSSITFTSTIACTLGAFICGPLGEKFGYQYPLILSGITTLLALFVAVEYQKLAK